MENKSLQLEPIETRALMLDNEIETKSLDCRIQADVERARAYLAWLSRMIQKQDMSGYVEPPGLGIAWLWKLPDDHPFQKAGLEHDGEYDLMREGRSPYATSLEPDLNFYRSCIRAAAEQQSMSDIETYLFEAGLFYRLVRAWGHFKWEPADGAAHQV